MERLVDLTSTPFYTAPMSRGVVPEDHPVSFQGARSTAMREADLVLVIGTRMNWMINYGQRFGNAKVIQIDIEASEIAHNRDVDLGIVGDAKAVLGQMVAEIEERADEFAGRLESPWIVRLQEDNDRRAGQQTALLKFGADSDPPPTPLQRDSRLPRPRRDTLR